MPKVGRRKGRARQLDRGPPRPGRRPFAASLGDLVNAEREIISQQQFDAARGEPVFWCHPPDPACLPCHAAPQLTVLLLGTPQLTPAPWHPAARTRTVDRGAMIAQLQRANTFAGADADQLERQARRAHVAAAAPLPRAEDEFETIMAEIEERNTFLNQVCAVGWAGWLCCGGARLTWSPMCVADEGAGQGGDV